MSWAIHPSIHTVYVCDINLSLSSTFHGFNRLNKRLIGHLHEQPHLFVSMTEILLYLCDAAETYLSSQLATYHLEIKASQDFRRNVFKTERRRVLFLDGSKCVHTLTSDIQ